MQADRVGGRLLASADGGADDFKEQRSKNKVWSSTNDVRTKVKLSRDGRTKSRSRLDCQDENEQQHEPEGERQPTKEDRSRHDEKNLMQQPEKMKVRQIRMLGDRQPLSGGDGVVRSHQPLLSVSAGVLQVMQRSKIAAGVLDPAAALIAGKVNSVIMHSDEWIFTCTVPIDRCPVTSL